MNYKSEYWYSPSKCLQSSFLCPKGQWSLIELTVPGVSKKTKKQYGVADYQFYCNTKQCSIFRHNKYNFYLVVCEILPVMLNVPKVMNMRRMMGQIGFRW